MNEEIARILHLLEEGKITAEEAERLIRALKEEAARPGGSGAHAGAPPRPSPAHDLADLLRDIARAARRAALRQRRAQWWRYYQFRAWQEHARARRAASQSVYDRVRFVLAERAVVPSEGLSPASRLTEDLRMDQMAWDNLAAALRDEFGIEVPPGELRGLPAVQALVDYVTGRLEGKPEPEENQ